MRAKQPDAIETPFTPVVVPTVVSEPIVDEPNFEVLANSFDDDAVVVNDAVDVELPSVVFCESWYATDVVECPRPFAAKFDAEVVENAAP